MEDEDCSFKCGVRITENEDCTLKVSKENRKTQTAVRSSFRTSSRSIDVQSLEYEYRGTMLIARSISCSSKVKAQDLFVPGISIRDPKP